MDNISEKIIDFYKNRQEPEDKIQFRYSLDEAFLYNPNRGIGDSLILSPIPKLAYQQKKNLYIVGFDEKFETLCKFNPWYIQVNRNNYHRNNLFDIAYIQSKIIAGNGHFTQRIQRVFGLPPEIKPKCLIECKKSKVKNRVALHLSAGKHQAIQKLTVHPRAREFYPEHFQTLQKFINDNLKNYEFLEYGVKFSGLQNINNRCNIPLEKTIEEMAECEYFIGLNSGPTHIATALNLKVISIINFPKANELYLPALKDLRIEDLDWLYPQNVHLHEDNDGELCRFFNYENLSKAFNGEIYPFWKDDYLNLINHPFNKIKKIPAMKL